ncbi:GyrI-like domain-containing protein [Pelagibacterium montanilacus]|uniref:GyrI-like domain-containing protein n=1 Tax=Pelagibacterium montanilacus TaxID=2185280 RepID=UPI000F8EFCF3|nr:GyrI-like domain-containing protein [Pelagibacterium montanilacus]
MLTLPEIVTRPEQPYAYIPFTVRMDQMQTPADQGFSSLFPFLAGQGIAPAAAPFYNYRRINMADTLDVEAGVPVGLAGQEGEGVRFGTLPAGRYATVAWHGHFDGLVQATAMLIGWCRLVGHEFDMHARPDGDYFACRLEIYETNPASTPDPKDWVTTLAFKLAD